MRLRTKDGRIRTITFKVFRNGTLHVTGPHSMDVADFVLQAFLETLNAIGGGYTLRPGRILLANYRTTLGIRLDLAEVANLALHLGHIPWLEANAPAMTMKLLVEQNTWASLRIFATGSVTISVPSCGPHRAQVGAFCRCVAFLRGLVQCE